MDLQSTANTAAAKLRDAQGRLEQARIAVIEASGAQHQAIVTSVSDQPATPAPAPKGKSASVPLDPVAAAAARLAAALAAYDAVRRELGIT